MGCNFGILIAYVQTMVLHSKKKSPGQHKKKKEEIGKTQLVTLRGVVIPVDWDAEGKVIATAISTHLEDEYLIMDEENIREMHNLINDEVEITGWCKRKGGKKMIKVKTCVRINADSPINKPPGNTL